MSQSDEDLMNILLGVKVEKKQGAIDQLYSRYADKLLEYFFYSLHHDKDKAADFVQDLFLKLIEKPEAFDTTKVFKAWVFRVAANMCKNEYRREGIDKKYQEHIALSGGEVDVITDKDNQVAFAINHLHDDYKSLIILRYKFKMTTKEIAAVLECPSGTVRSKLFYATKELSKYIKR